MSKEMTWYAAHVVIYVQLKDQTQKSFPAWENIILIHASTDEEAFTKAEEKGKSEEGDDNGSFTWGGKPAIRIFGGVRKLIFCEDVPKDGVEITYLELNISKQKLKKLLEGKPTIVRYE